MSDPTLPPDPYDPSRTGATPPPSGYVSGQPYGPPASPQYGSAPVGYGSVPVGYGTSPVPTNSSDAIVALVLAILSWFACPVVLAIVALVFAGKGKRAIAASNGWVTGDGLVTAARVISWINIGLFLLLGVILVAGLVVAAMSTSVSSSS